MPIGVPEPCRQINESRLEVRGGFGSQAVLVALRPLDFAQGSSGDEVGAGPLFSGRQHCGHNTATWLTRVEKRPG